MPVQRFEFPPAQTDPRARLERLYKPFEEYKQRRDQALAKLRAPPEEDQSHLFCWGGAGSFTFDDIPSNSISVTLKDDPDKPKKKKQEKILEWNQTGGVYETIRVENPDDPEQYVIIFRWDKVYFQPPGDDIKEWTQYKHGFQMKWPSFKSKNPR